MADGLVILLGFGLFQALPCMMILWVRRERSRLLRRRAELLRDPRHAMDPS